MRLRNIPGAQDAILESPYVVQEPQTKKGHWGEVFAKKQPLHIEVGMGKGRFLMDLARLHPDINYIGIEMYDSVLLRALQKREELEENGEVYSNLFFMRVDARLLPEIFEKGEVDKIYLNFSDPWPKARHALSVFSRELKFVEEEDETVPVNQIFLDGYICKPPVYRKTPLGREIADVLLAVNRPYGKSDYIPCICWGRNARYASAFEVGGHVLIWGRIQSREYMKRIGENETEKRVAYEVSVSKLEYME